MKVCGGCWTRWPRFERTTPTTAPTSGNRATKRASITGQDFYEQLAEATDNSLAADLTAFMDRLAQIRVTPVYGASSLNLRWFQESNRKMNFGSIRKNGTVDTDAANWVPTNIGRREIGEYQEALATILGGKAVKVPNAADYSMRVLRSDSSMLKLSDLLNKKDEWFGLIV